jgi:hypothetical protein
MIGLDGFGGALAEREAMLALTGEADARESIFTFSGGPNFLWREITPSSGSFS